MASTEILRDSRQAKFLTKVVEWVKEAVTEGDESKIVEALEELESQVTDIDNAGDLDHVGGVDLVLELLTHPMAKVRQMAFWVVGTTVQSHSKMQEMLLARGVLPKIMQPLGEKTQTNYPPTDSAYRNFILVFGIHYLEDI